VSALCSLSHWIAGGWFAQLRIPPSWEVEDSEGLGSYHRSTETPRHCPGDALQCHNTCGQWCVSSSSCPDCLGGLCPCKAGPETCFSISMDSGSASSKLTRFLVWCFLWWWELNPGPHTG
jgi:hypothetical protein